MQSHWFLNGIAEAYERLNDYAMALKYFHKVDKIFVDVSDDQFDFHSYSMRRCVLRAYVDMIRYEDRLQDHQYYKRAALGIIRVNEKLASGLVSVPHAITLPVTKVEKIDGVETDKAVVVVDADPQGLGYLALDHCKEVIRFSMVLSMYSPYLIESWVARCKAYTDKGTNMT